MCNTSAIQTRLRIEQHAIADDLAAEGGWPAGFVLVDDGQASGISAGGRRPGRGLSARRRVGRPQDPHSHLHAVFEAELLVEAARADVLHRDVQERVPPARTDVVHE
jgi:hypothetical protein